MENEETSDLIEEIIIFFQAQIKAGSYRSILYEDYLKALYRYMYIVHYKKENLSDKQLSNLMNLVDKMKEVESDK